MNSTRQIQHCGNTGTHSHNRSLAQNSNTNISGFQCNRIVYLRFNNTSSHLTSSRSEGIQFGFNHIQFGPIRNQPSRFFFREQQLHTCTPEWEIAQTNQHNRTLQTRIHSHIQPPKATLRDHPPHPKSFHSNTYRILLNQQANTPNTIPIEQSLSISSESNYVSKR